MAVHTLYLRKLALPGGGLLGGSEVTNAFTEEFNLVLDIALPAMDCCVMRAIDKEMPILSQQECLHAKMHREALRERTLRKEPGARWDWLGTLAHVMLNRAGQQFAIGCVGHVEATSGIFLYVAAKLPFLPGFFNDAVMYHVMEELEHGPLTTASLRQKVHPLVPLLAFPFMALFFVALFLLPPVGLLLAKPWLLLRPRTYTELVLYYLTFVPTWVVTVAACIAFWVLPFKESAASHAKHYAFFRHEVERRGIAFEVIDQKTYYLQ